MAVTSEVSICNTALIFVGATEITSFTDETREAKVCAAIFDKTYEFMLQQAIWRFSLELIQLAKLTTPPTEADEFGFANAFQLPSNSLRIISTDSPSDNYKQFGDNILSNESRVSVTYQKKPDVTDLPAYFQRALELELTALLSLALNNDESEYAIWQRKADKELARARHIDSQQQPVSNVGSNNFLFTSVRER